jgi:hypothetical protein
MAIHPFAGQPPDAVITAPYPVTQRGSPAVINGAVSVNQTGSNATAVLSSVVVNITASGDTTIRAGTTSQTIAVYRAVLSATGAVTITVKSGAATALSGPIPLTTSDPLIIAFDGHPYWTTTNSTDSLVINLSTTASLGGNVWLVQS